MDDAEFMYWPYSPDGPTWEPDDIPDDIEAFLDHVQELTGDIRRHLHAPVRHAVPRRHKSNEGPPVAPKIEIVLYTSAESEKSQKALRVIRGVLDMYNSAQVKFSTCDLSQSPQDGEVDSVVFTPTLVKQGPGPRTSIIGNLDQEEILKDLLDASGVDRRRWDD